MLMNSNIMGYWGVGNLSYYYGAGAGVTLGGVAGSIAVSEVVASSVTASSFYMSTSITSIGIMPLLYSMIYNNYMAALGSLSASMSITHTHLDISILNLTKTHKIADDKFGVGKGMGANRKSNLANSPEVVIALHQILKSNRYLSLEQVKEKLKKEYGIDAEITTIKGVKALKFANGDYIVDTNGNNSLDMGDYNFKGAIKELSKKYGVDINKMKPEEIKALVQRLKSEKMWGEGMSFMNLSLDTYTMNLNSAYGLMMYNTPEILSLFATAYQYAV